MRLMILDMVLITPQRGMMILINIYVLYNDSHEGYHPGFASFTRVITGFEGFTRVILWWLRSYEVPMDGPIERPHMGLIYIYICDVPLPYVVWLAFQLRRIWGGVRMLWFHRVAYQGQHQCRALYMIFYSFKILKIVHIMF